MTPADHLLFVDLTDAIKLLTARCVEEWNHNRQLEMRLEELEEEVPAMAEALGLEKQVQRHMLQ